jgi:predicted nucleic acid-binding protein
MIVLDANILIRAVLGRRVRQLLEEYESREIRFYAPDGDFEEEARQRLRGRDEEDWPVLAAGLALACPIWSEDTDFFGTGAAVWTTNRIEIFLNAQKKPFAPDSE